MSAITARLLHCRPLHRSYPNTLHRFSTSPAPDSADPHQRTEQDSEFRQTPTPPISSYLNDLKASLRQEPPQQNRPTRPRPFSNPISPPPPQTPTSPYPLKSLDEIRRNLSEYRRRADPPPPPFPPSDQPVSWEELYRRNQNSNSAVQAPSIGLLSEKIRKMGPTEGRNRSGFGPKSVDPSVFNRFKDSINQTIDPNAQLDSTSFFLKKKGTENDDTVSVASERSALIRAYDKPELGKKLQMLRPSKTKGDWFTFQELNERLARLKEKEEKEESAGGFNFSELRQSLITLNNSKEEKQKKLQNFNVFRTLGTTQDFMLEPPKEHLVEQYFHPDCMSSAEKLKLELKKVRDEFKMSESDCGSARVQVAQLTTKIKHLSTVLAKKDKHSRKGLLEMVQRRKKLLKYLRRTDWDSYSLVLSKLGLRDNPDTKIKA